VRGRLRRHIPPSHRAYKNKDKRIQSPARRSGQTRTHDERPALDLRRGGSRAGVDVVASRAHGPGSPRRVTSHHHRKRASLEAISRPRGRDRTARARTRRAQRANCRERTAQSRPRKRRAAVDDQQQIARERRRALAQFTSAAIPRARSIAICAPRKRNGPTLPPRSRTATNRCAPQGDLEARGRNHRAPQDESRILPSRSVSRTAARRHRDFDNGGARENLRTRDGPHRAMSAGPGAARCIRGPVDQVSTMERRSQDLPVHWRPAALQGESQILIAKLPKARRDLTTRLEHKSIRVVANSSRPLRRVALRGGSKGSANLALRTEVLSRALQMSNARRRCPRSGVRSRARGPRV